MQTAKQLTQSILESYGSPDFYEDVHLALNERMSEAYTLGLIQKMFKEEHQIDLSDKQAQKIAEWFKEDGEPETYSSYYVGDNCIAAYAFGEQSEELITFIHNGYSKEDLIEAFDDAGFYVSWPYAYYDMSDSGLYYDLRHFMPAVCPNTARFDRSLFFAWLEA